MFGKTLLVAALLISASISTAAETPEKKGPVYATLKTSMGDIVIQLFEDKAPKTVANFIGLASGTKEWTDPKTGEKVKRSLYNGTIFHRVIPGFMIQGGDPLGNGTGGPGYKFDDEFNSELRHTRGGILSMANAGPNTNGSQFFILHQDYPLPPNYVIFARVTSGMDAVDAIANTPTGPGDDGAMSRPLSPQVIKKVTIRP
jgi:peptidyl-prolyl cis-trans isomerase A (cyclophilin A)